jgi:predicted RNA-binding Zn-ribbon protein involved in translation (DUF1610 family)
MIFSNAISRLLATTLRQCPKCGGRQRVPAAKRGYSVNCKSCGASIPASAEVVPFEPKP